MAAVSRTGRAAAILSLVSALFLIVALASGQMQPAQIFILVGPPGSGKSVQARLLSRKYKVPAISLASLLQKEMGRNSALTRALEGSVASGELVSHHAADQVIQTRLLQSDAGRGFILDGYPNTEEQAKALDVFLAEHDFPKPTVIVLSAPDSVLRERMKARRRADDTAETAERRIREYRHLETFTEKRYGSESTVRVNGTGSIQQVASLIASGIERVRSKKGLIVRPSSGEGLRRRPAEEGPTP